jgi:RHS repeat-associated protein
MEKYFLPTCDRKVYAHRHCVNSKCNLVSDGVNTYAWDAENRLVQISYPGTNNYTQFSYDAYGGRVSIAETTNGTVSSTMQFVFADGGMCETRDASGNLLNQFFKLGERITSTSYFWSVDHPTKSVRTLTNSSGTIVAEYAYSPDGKTSVIQQSVASDFQYSGLYHHSRSGLGLSATRVYNSSLGRWLSRDPIENPPTNLYLYANNAPTEFSDPSGLAPSEASGAEFLQAEAKMEQMCSCQCGVPHKPQQSCQKEASAIVSKLYWVWMASCGRRHRLGFSTMWGGHQCDGWANIYMTALNSLDLNVWKFRDQYSQDANQFWINQAWHWWVQLCVQDKSGCRLWIDDGYNRLGTRSGWN